MQFRKWMAWACAVTLVLALARSVPLSAQGEGPNLLQDGDFEWSAPWPIQDKYFPINVAPGWHAWWLPTPPKDIPKPSNCQGQSDNGCYWAVPEFTDVQKIAFAYRVRNGLQAQKYFTYGRMHQAGLWQQVGGIAPGARLRFSIYMQAWMCYEFVKACNNGRVSDQPGKMHLKVGLDPTGGDKPWGPDVVWSNEGDAWDQWVLFQVEAVAKASTVTVFTHSRADWDWARTNNDVYLDDASLVVIGQAPAAQPTSAPKLQQPTQSAQVAQVPATRPPQPSSTSAPTRAPTPTLTLTPTLALTPTDTPAPTETPVRRVATLPPEDTPTPSPFSRLGGSSGSLIGLVFLGVAGFLGALAAGALIGRRSRPTAG